MNPLNLASGPGMNFAQITVIMFAYVTAGFVKGVTGLGFSTTCLPILVFAMGLKQALPLVLIPSVVLNLFLMASTPHFRGTVKRFWRLFLAQLPGIAMGLWVLTMVDGRLAAAVLGIVIIGYAGYALFRPTLTLGSQVAQTLRVPVGGSQLDL